MIVPPLKPTMMITTIVDFLRELVSELSFQAPYFVFYSMSFSATCPDSLGSNA